MPNSGPILHHHDPSPFAEKIRLVFGIKRLAWSSVQIPMMTPRPDLIALTGGYRGTPVLQIGADIYCDTRLIVRELERRYPTSTLLQSGPLVNFGLQHWSDDAVFPPGAALAMYEGASAMPDNLLVERAAYFTNLDFSRFAVDAAYFRMQLEAHLALVEEQLSDNRAFLLGDAPEWADLNAYFPVWMLINHVPGADLMLEGKPHLRDWQRRISDFGTGDRREIDAAAAITIAREVSLAPVSDGKKVSVFPVAHPETAVKGLLVERDDPEIVVRVYDPRTGGTNVHFPSVGYRIETDV